MYGTRFIQYFGWYVNQAYLRLGMRPMSFRFLPDICPAEMQELAKTARLAHDVFQVEQERLMAIAAGPERSDIGPDEAIHWKNVRQNEARAMIALRRAAARAERRLTKAVEDTVRQEFGFKKVGEGWISETLLYQLVARVLPGREIVRHAHPEWLGGLELDIFVPSLDLALEYQGQQHFHAIKAWGGQGGLDRLLERDHKKARVCEKRGITLVAFHYTEPLTDDHLREVLERGGIEGVRDGPVPPNNSLEPTRTAGENGDSNAH